MEAPHDHVIILVVPRVSYGYVPEDTEVRLQDIVFLVPHLSPHMDHTPRNPISAPGASL